MAAQSITLVGNLTGAPELRFGAGGTPVCRLTVACQDRYRDASGEWKHGDTLFQRAVIFGAMAENFAASFNRGDRVLLTGALRQSDYEHTDEATGEKSKRYSTDFVVEDAGGSVKWSEVRVNRAARVSTGRRVAAQDEPAPDPWESVNAPAPELAPV